jgi:hypothetical protein
MLTFGYGFRRTCQTLNNSNGDSNSSDQRLPAATGDNG